jgi:hypothetical protein
MRERQVRGKKPETFDQAVQQMSLTEDEKRLLAEEGRKNEAAAALSDDTDLGGEEDDSPLAHAAEDPGEPEGPDVPPWCVVPEGLHFPVGRTVAFVRVPSVWTERPDKGLIWDGKEREPKFQGKKHRQCILWTLSIADEKLARASSRGDAYALVAEMAKRQIRAIDGQLVDWTTGNVDPSTARSAGAGGPSFGEMNFGSGKAHAPTFWSDIGAPMRSFLTSHYQRTHAFTRQQLEHFFLNCFVVKRAETG